MVEGLPGSDFAGIKHGGGSGAVWRRGLFACLVCIARCFIVRVVLLSGAYCSWRISMF